MTNEQPLVWMNVTTSANWNRPAVGIVRVEQALCEQLARLYGDRFRRCVWLDGEFVEFRPGQSRDNPDLKAALDQLLPPTQTFDLARKFLAGRLTQFGKRSRRTGEPSILAEIPVKNWARRKPMAGDVLVSIGLDWDGQYTDQFYKFGRDKGIKIITCCYDLIPVIFPQYCVGDVAGKFKAYFNRLSWGSAAVLCISKQSQSDLLKLWHDTGTIVRKTEVIPLGDNIPSGDGEISPEVERLTSEPFILFVSTIERRKNHEVVYRAYHLLSRAGHKAKLPKLVFVGMPGWGAGDLLSDLNLDPFTQDLIVQLHHVSDAELLALYKRAQFCVYPSFYEGWGLPVGEALSLGKPVLASDQGSLPEVGGDLVRYVSPWDPQDWAAAILEWIENPDLLAAEAKKVTKGYRSRTWSDTAVTVARVIDEVIAQPRPEPVFYPGYDFSCQAGLHVGPYLRSTGRAGFLMHGPYLGLAPGRYTATVEGTFLPDSTPGSLDFDIAHDRGSASIAVSSLSASELHPEESAKRFAVEMSFSLDRHVDDLEIRCVVHHGVLVDLERVTITEAKPRQPKRR